MRSLDHRFRVGIDIGGTFTDLVLLDGSDAEARRHKRLTTPHDPSEGALAGFRCLLGEAGVPIGDVCEIVHGTTLVANAIIERRGAAVGMLTTRGFRDVLEIGTEQRYDIYDLFLTFPEPLVQRRWRIEIAERVGADGQVIVPLDEDAVVAAALELIEDGVEALAVCFLHSHRNRDHEQRAHDILKAAFPGLPVSISSAVAREISEYQRFVTTCANAFVQPLMSRYLSRMTHELDALGFRGALSLMHSAGGLVSVDVARELPIRLIESGPAGGALAAAWFARVASTSRVIAFDMGGTTAKACVIEDDGIEVAPSVEAARIHRFKHGSGLPIKTASVDMIEIGAGGGSIASVNDVGLMQVGPYSAGAEPGPACYGRGGEKPTVTDASVVLGYYDPASLLGGGLALDQAAADKAVGSLAEQLGLTTIEVAWGVHEVVAENMASAAQIHLVEKGKDPRNFAMVGFGGAGPAFAARVARILGISEVIIPPGSGTAAAFGFLTAPLSYDAVRSWPMVLSEAGGSTALADMLIELEAEGRGRLRNAGVCEEDMSVERSVDMRMVGQLHEINVPAPRGETSPGWFRSLRVAFDTAYEAHYAQIPEGTVEALTFRVRASGPAPKVQAGRSAVDATDFARARKHARRVYFDGVFLEAPVYERSLLPAGVAFAGPAIIEERESTIIVPPGDSALADDAGNLRIAVAGTRKGVRRPSADIEGAVQEIEADPIALEIMWSRLVTVAEQMWSAVCRTAFSMIIAESQDFGCAILDPNGETLAHSNRIMPVFSLTLPLAAKALLERHPADTLEPGDVLITNDPWRCAGHLYDLAIVTPVFRGDRVVALMGTVGHVGDIGGSRDGLSVSEVYEEGLQIPPMKLMNAGSENEDLFRLIGENVRGANQVIGDIRSFVAANASGARRILAFMDEYDLEDLTALGKVIHSRSERATRDAVRAIPDGVYTSEIRNNPLGEGMRFPLQLTVEEDAIILDFDGAPPQTSAGGINCTLSYTMAHSTYPLKCVLTPSLRGNAGCYRPFTVNAPVGSILNCVRPAPVSLRTRTGWYLAPNLLRALSGASPERVQAFSALPSVISVYGQHSDGTLFYDHLLLGGGQGASQVQDGKSALLWPTSAATSSLELFESRSPVVVLEKALVQDSGGAGRHRGGLGVRVRLSKRHDDGQSLTVVVSPEGVDAPVEGLCGGAAGATAHSYLLDANGDLVRDCGTGEVLTLRTPREVIELVLSGGSGFGSPGERDTAAVAADVAQGYVSGGEAAKTYGTRG